MDKNDQINKLIDEAINSIDNISRAGAMPFLLTRVNARLANANKSWWEEAGKFIAKPAVAITGLAIFIVINVTAIVMNNPGTYAYSTEISSQPDEFSYAIANMYDIENIEP